MFNKKRGLQIKQTISWLILIIFIVVVEWLWGWQRIFQPWTAISLTNILIGVSLLLVTYALRALRLYDYFYGRVYWWQGMRLMLLHNFLNNLLPARTGELSFPILMKRYFGIDYKESTPALLWFRLLDLYVILVIAFFVWSLNQAMYAWYALWLAFLFSPWLVFIFKSMVKKVSQKYLSGKHQAFVDDVLMGLPRDVMQFLKSWLITILNWTVKLLVIAWFMSLFIELDFGVRVYASITGELTSILPVHAPGGFGTYEAGILSVLGLYDIDMELAATTAVNTHLFILGGSLVGGIVGWLIPKKES